MGLIMAHHKEAQPANRAMNGPGSLGPRAGATPVGPVRFMCHKSPKLVCFTNADNFLILLIENQCEIS